MVDLSVSLGKLKLANPVLVASGTFGYGQEYEDLVALDSLGAIITKTITLRPQEGNPPPRVFETTQGVLNSIGLENPGVEGFIQEKLPILQKLGIPIVVSIAGENPRQFACIARRLKNIPAIAALELNISCPNLGHQGLIAQDARATYKVVKAVKEASRLTVITKLSPNVTDITLIARAAKEAGTDVLSLVNTFLAMAVDIQSSRPRLGNITGGLSGPAIKPQALWMLRQVFKAVKKIPIIGIGGIVNTQDALEFLISGASAVAIGTANFVNPRASLEIIAGITKYLKANKIASVSKIIGVLKE